MKQNELNDYLQQYPSLRKWINECPVCHIIGYKPEMPEHIGGEDSVAGRILEKCFALWRLMNLDFVQYVVG